MSLLKNPKIIFLTPYPCDTAPGQRFRFEQYYSLLKNQDYELRVLSFLSRSAYGKLYRKGYVFSNLISIMWGFFKRISHLYILRSADFIFLFREAAPIGPPIFEWFISKVLNKKIIYDFDDAIWLTDKPNESKIEKVIRWRNKVSSICRWSHKIRCGNRYLANYALRYNNKVRIVPTTIDTHKYLPTQRNMPKEKIVIGWSGSFSTIKHFSLALPALKRIQEIFKDKIEFHVIGNSQFTTTVVNVVSKDWNKLRELKDLQEFDIGIMPLPNDEWSQGKCGLKGLQYMALEIPTIMSPVGVNKDVIQDGVNGYLAETDQDWVDKISMLIRDHELRIKIGKAGRKTVIDNYSVVSEKNTYLEEFETLSK